MTHLDCSVGTGLSSISWVNERLGRKEVIEDTKCYCTASEWLWVIEALTSHFPRTPVQTHMKRIFLEVYSCRLLPTLEICNYCQVERMELTPLLL